MPPEIVLVVPEDLQAIEALIDRRLHRLERIQPQPQPHQQPQQQVDAAKLEGA